MDVWLVGCWACIEDRCIVIYDHKPTERELSKMFCSSVVRNNELGIKRCDLSEIFNKKVDDLF